MQRWLFLWMLCATVAGNAEIEELTITWNAAICREGCTKPLTRQLESIRGVASFSIDEQAGSASITWKPTEVFSFGYLNMASRSVGFRIIDTRIVVRGTVTRRGDEFYLTSLGDSTKFRLLGPLKTDASRFSITYNIANHPVTPQMKDKLLDAEKRALVVTVTGALFEPQRYDLMIVVLKIELPEPKAVKKAADRRELRTGRFEPPPAPPAPGPTGPEPLPPSVPPGMTGSLTGGTGLPEAGMTALDLPVITELPSRTN